jgi:hypothetical protein
MAALQINDVVETMYPFAPGAPEALLVRAWRDAARRFFTETRAWRVEPVITLSVLVGATYAEYDMTSPFNETEVFDFAELQYQLCDIPRYTREQVRARGIPTAGGVPVAARMGSPDNMVVMPVPSGDLSADMSVLGMIRPTRSAIEIDDSVEKYFDVIDFGALEYVLRVPGQPWTDIKLSVGYNEKFEAEVDEHMHKGSDGDMRGVRRTVRYGGL